MDKLLQYTYNEPGQAKRLKIDALNKYPLITNEWDSKSSTSFTEWIAGQPFNYDENGEPLWFPTSGLEDLEGKGYTIFDPSLPSFLANPELAPPNAPTYAPPPNFFDGCDKIRAYIDEYYSNKGEATPHFPSDEALRYMADKIKHDNTAILGVDYIYPTIENYPTLIPLCAETAYRSWLAFRASNGNSRIYQGIFVLTKFRKATKSNYSYAKAIKDIKTYNPPLTGTAAVREYRTPAFNAKCKGLTDAESFNKITSKKSYSIPPFSYGTVTLSNEIINCKYPAGCTHMDDTRNDIYDEGVNDILTTYVVGSNTHACIASGWFYRLIGNSDSDNENLVHIPCPLSQNVYPSNGTLKLNVPIAKSVQITRANNDPLRGLTEVSGVKLSMDDTFEIIDESNISIPDTTGTFTMTYIENNSDDPECNKEIPLCNFSVCKDSDTTILIVKPGKLPGADADTEVTNMSYEVGDASVKIDGNTVANSRDLFYSNASDRSSVKQIIINDTTTTNDNITVSGHTEYDYDVPGTRYHVSEYYNFNNVQSIECGEHTVYLVSLYSTLSIRHQNSI